MTIRSLYRQAPNWFATPLPLQDSGLLHTTWRYSDLIAVLYESSTVNWLKGILDYMHTCMHQEAVLTLTSMSLSA